MRASEGNQPTTIVYVAGDGRSGSTLLEGLLAAATGAVAVGEIRMFLAAGFRWGARCGCGEPFTECEFWRSVMVETLPENSERAREALEAAGRGLISNRRTRRLLRGRERWSDEERAFAAVHVDLYRSVAARSGALVIIDSSKTPAYGLFLAAQPEIDLRVVHLVRDARAVAHSWTRRKEWKAAADGSDQKSMRRLGTGAAARQWITQNLFCEILERQVDRAVTVRYEDLASEPEAVVRDMLEQLDVETSTAPAQTDHGFLGNPMRFDERPPAVALDDAWMREMPASSRRLSTLLTFPLLLRHRYPLRSSPREVDGKLG